MISGVIIYSFTTSSFTTLITSVDSSNAKLKLRISQLNSLHAKYNINLRLYHKIEKVLKYDHSKNDEFELSFLNEVPQRLKVELSFRMYRKYIEKLPFFQNQNGHFISFVCPMLIPRFIPENEILYREGDPINGIYFLLKGKIGMILNPILKQDVYMYIEEGHYFGEIDLLSKNDVDFSILHANTLDKKRKFTCVSMEVCDLILWNKKSMYQAENEFGNVIKEIFRNAKDRYKKAFQAKKEAMEYFNSLQRRSDISNFVPMVTRAVSSHQNIFDHK